MQIWHSHLHPEHPKNSGEAILGSENLKNYLLSHMYISIVLHSVHHAFRVSELFAEANNFR